MLNAVRQTPYRMIASNVHFTCMELAATLDRNRFFSIASESDYVRIACAARDHGERGLLVMLMGPAPVPPSELVLPTANGTLRMKTTILQWGWLRIFECAIAE